MKLKASDRYSYLSDVFYEFLWRKAKDRFKKNEKEILKKGGADPYLFFDGIRIILVVSLYFS